jgi:alkanesulfonate monooxygenase SsuD/methylene tetrahydromethanopterin reductase-like flavin-dependent oxidoreductase (luciferase family)
MDFGLFSNGERTNQIAADTYDEDLYEVTLADKLGFKEAWISEHLGSAKAGRPDTLSMADMFIVKAAAHTKQMKFGPGVRPIAMYHPVQVAIESAMADHLTRGRYMFGFGYGGPATDGMLQRGLGSNDPKLRRERMNEAIDLITRCWTATEPFDYEGAFWQGKNIHALPKPYQKPHMPVGVANSTSAGTAELAARHGFMPLFSQYDEAPHMRKLRDVYIDAAREAGVEPKLSTIRACRFCWVSDSTNKAKEELRPSITSAIERQKRYFPDHFRNCLPPSGDVMDVTWDHIVDTGHYFVGSPDRVVELIKNHYDVSGGFGTLLMVCGKDYGTRQQRARSMRLFMQEVAPRLKELDPDRKGELEAVF